jgi:sec-independent protein translocase protein TatA
MLPLSLYRAFLKEHAAMGLKMSEILLIFAAMILLFGASRLPQLGSSLGSAIRNFKKGFAGEEEGGNQPASSGGNGQIAQGSNAAAPAADKAKQG